MPEKLHRSSSELDLDPPYLPYAPLGVPGKVATTSRLPGRMILRVRDGNGVDAGADVAVERATSSSGQALPAELRGRFESSLGADLSGVRVHTGAESAQAASAVGAKAYTTGQDIHFADGRYDPSSAFGVHLLAHEVAHTVQQRGGTPTTQHKLEVSGPQDAAEVEADRAADAMVAGTPATIAGSAAVVARDADPAAEAAPKKAQLAAQIRIQKGPLTFIGSSDENGKFAVSLQATIALPPIVVIPPAVSLNGQFIGKAEASGKLSEDGSVAAGFKGSLAVQGTINGGIPRVASIYAGVQLAAEMTMGKLTRTADGAWDVSLGDTIALVGKLLVGIQLEMPDAVKEALPEGWTPALRYEWAPGGPMELVTFNVATGKFSAGADVAAIQSEISSILGAAQDSVRAFRNFNGGRILSSPCEDDSGAGGAPPAGCPEPADKAPLQHPGEAPETCDPETASCEEET